MFYPILQGISMHGVALSIPTGAWEGSPLQEYFQYLVFHLVDLKSSFASRNLLGQVAAVNGQDV